MKDLETRVWQRVQQGKEEPAASTCADSLPALIMEQLQLSAVYMQLSRQTGGQTAPHSCGWRGSPGCRLFA